MSVASAILPSTPYHYCEHWEAITSTTFHSLIWYLSASPSPHQQWLKLSLSSPSNAPSSLQQMVSGTPKQLVSVVNPSCWRAGYQWQSISLRVHRNYPNQMATKLCQKSVSTKNILHTGLNVSIFWDALGTGWPSALQSSSCNFTQVPWWYCLRWLVKLLVLPQAGFLNFHVGEICDLAQHKPHWMDTETRCPSSLRTSEFFKMTKKFHTNDFLFWNKGWSAVHCSVGQCAICFQWVQDWLCSSLLSEVVPWHLCTLPLPSPFENKDITTLIVISNRWSKAYSKYSVYHCKK